MGSEARKILEDAMALSADERAALAHELLASLDGEREPGVDEAWAAEIKLRAERFRAGESQGIPWEEAKARLLEQFGPKREPSGSTRRRTPSSSKPPNITRRTVLPPHCGS
jgi:putative addiction module component (TIGR02574 family)